MQRERISKDLITISEFSVWVKSFFTLILSKLNLSLINSTSLLLKSFQITEFFSRSSLDCSISLIKGYKYLDISTVILINASNSLSFILLLTNDFLNGLLFLNFQIETLFGRTSFKLSLLDKTYRDCIPFKSIVSRINNNKSSFSIDCLDTWFPFAKTEIVLH